MKQYFKVSFQYSETVFCTNIAHAETVQDVEKHYNKYEWSNVAPATDAEVDEARRKGMPVVEIESTPETEAETENDHSIRIEWNGGKSYAEMDLQQVLPATPANMKRIIDMMEQTVEPWTYAETINDYIRKTVLDLIVERGGLDEKTQYGQKKIAELNKDIRRFTANSAALAKRYDVQAVTDKDCTGVKIGKGLVEALELDRETRRKYIAVYSGYSFTVDGLQFDMYRPEDSRAWRIFLHGTGLRITECDKKQDAPQVVKKTLEKVMNAETKKKLEKAMQQFNEIKENERREHETMKEENKTVVIDAEYIENLSREKATEKATDPEKDTAPEKSPEAVQKAENTPETIQTDATPENNTPAPDMAKELKKAKELDLSVLDVENVLEYLPSLVMMLSMDKHNNSIIMCAGIEAGIISPVEIVAFFQRGIMPPVHTFDEWKKNGYTVKKGEKRAFDAYIWKYVEKEVTLSEEEAASMNACSLIDGMTYAAGDTISRGNFIRKKAYFFRVEQVEKTPEIAPLPALPEDVKKEIRGGCCWISGNTRPIKDDLKAAGFRWSKRNAAWYRREAA